MKILGLCSAFIFLFVCAADALSAEKEQKQNPSLSKQEVQKLRDIAVIIAGEITKRDIKSVTVTDFKDIKGNPSKMGKTVAAEFRRQMEALGKTNFTVEDSGGGAFVTGMFLPFKGGDKWRLDIKVFSPDSRLITSYSGFYRKIKGVKEVKRFSAVQIFVLSRVEAVGIGVPNGHNPPVKGTLWIDKIRFYR